MAHALPGVALALALAAALTGCGGASGGPSRATPSATPGPTASGVGATAVATKPAAPPAATRTVADGAATAAAPRAVHRLRSASGRGSAVTKLVRRGGPVVTSSTPSGGSATASSSAYAFTGSGDERLGTIRLTTRATLRWTASGRPGAHFEIASADGAIAVRSTAAGGLVGLAAGAVRDVSVRAAGRWTVVIVPAG
ncbi:MAG TPA: hypothetical protein VFF79_09625 [Conexibacter sp.]|nr:hypothetical protein [Conexibacter sp.]